MTDSETPPGETRSSEVQVGSPIAQAGAKALTIAVLIDNANFFEGCYEASLRQSLDAKCRQCGYNLLLVYGGALDPPSPAGSAGNAIYRALRPGTFDGIIVVSSMLAAFGSPGARLPTDQPL